MSITPFPIQCLRNAQWTIVQTDELLPGDVVSIGASIRSHHLTITDISTFVVVRQQNETSVPADILLVKGSCIVNEAMLSGESTPLLKESIQLLEGAEKLDADAQHRNAVLFSGTKVLQATPGGKSLSSDWVA
jgi:manganese-transporting P-type ATPase